MKQHPFLHLSLLAALLLASPVLAQPAEDTPRMARETLEALFIVTLKNELALDTVSAVDLAEKLRPILEGRREFNRRQRRLEKALHSKLRQGNADAASLDEDVRKILDLRLEFVQAERQTFLEATAQLQSEQKARALLLLERFEKKVRRQLREHKDLGRDNED